MLNFPVKYKIIIVKDKTGYIASNHQNKELLISNDIKLNITDDGKLCAMFQANSKPGCSVTISDPSCFNHCIQKNDMYQLSGSNVTFNGTDKADTLILNGCENSEVNMGDGNDTVLYRENKVASNNINLGNGNNIFAPTFKTDADRALINNNITSGSGKDYIYLRNAIGNSIDTGADDDIIEIEGAPQTKFTNYFIKNTIYTKNGNDIIRIFGTFDRFQDNGFYLGKGSDTFSASINPQADAKTELEYNDKLYGYIDSVSKNRIYATEGKKGFFEKNTFEATTYSANQFNENISTRNVSEGFQNYTTKPVPRSFVNTNNTDDNKVIKTESRIENAKKRYWLGSFGSNLFGDSKMQEAAFKALDDYVKIDE